MKLTVKNTVGLKLPPGKLDHIEFDDDIPGFGVRLREGGSRNYIFQYKVGAKQRRIGIGSLSAIAFGKARDAAENYYARVRLGHDPAGETAEKKSKAHKTFKTVADDFLEYQQQRLRPRTYLDVERHLLNYSKTLHELQVDKIQRADIAAVLASVQKQSGDVSRNRARASLSKFYSWAISEGRADGNPVIGTSRADEASRDRVLSPTELCLIWNSLPADHFGTVMKLLALTGQRAGEVAGMKWSEVDFDHALWTLPGERTKNKRAHTVPLSPEVKALIEEQPKRATAGGELRDLIFGTREGPFSGWSKAKAELDATIKKKAGKPIPRWTPHDLRRSFATHSAEMGIAPHIIELVLNHVSGHRAGVAGIYNRSTNEPEKRAALVRWGDQLTAWVEGRKANVTQLRRPA